MRIDRLIALALAVCALAAPAAARGAVYAAQGVYRVEYSDDMTLDDRAYAGDSTDDYTWLFMLYNDEYTVDADMRRLAGYEGFSLYAADEDEKAWYLAATLDALDDVEGELAEALTVDADGAAIPFYLYRAKDEDGSYYMAETIAGGYALDLYAYYSDMSRPADEALYRRLCELVMSFRPLGAAVTTPADK